MWGTYFRGSQWVNTFYPDIKQVLGGFDEGAKMEKQAPFDFDYLVKESGDVESLQEMAIEYHVKYIVIDETYMKRQQLAYRKFRESSVLVPLEDVNELLQHASIYEVKGVQEEDDIQDDYFYWDIWRILGLIISLVALPVYIVFLFRIDLKVPSI